MSGSNKVSAVHRIRMSQRPDGVDVAELDWGGQTLRAETRTGAVMAVARIACEAGAAPGPWEGVDSGTGAKRLYGPSLHALAQWTITEPDRGGFQRRRWKPYPERT